MGKEPPAPERWRKNDRNRGHSEKLHGEIGSDRARPAEQVVHWSAGCMAQARVIDRPGRKREDRNTDAGEHDEPADLAQTPSDRGMKVVRQGRAVVMASFGR